MFNDEFVHLTVPSHLGEPAAALEGESSRRLRLILLGRQTWRGPALQRSA